VSGLAARTAFVRDRIASTFSAPLSEMLSREEIVDLLVEAAGKLVKTRIVEDPFAQSVGDESNALYCSECFRYALRDRPLEHAPLCPVGRVAALIAALKPMASGGVVHHHHFYGSNPASSDVLKAAVRDAATRAANYLQSQHEKKQRELVTDDRPDRVIVYDPVEHPTAVELR
jgi:hypothetical protein